MTSLSLNELTTLGPSIGFFPDNPLSWTYSSTKSVGGTGVCNNTNLITSAPVSITFNNYRSGTGNDGFLARQQNINFDPDGIPLTLTYASFITAARTAELWKSHISQKLATSVQFSISAVVYLKHLHSFFQFIPLLKGVYMKMTLNLNNASCQVQIDGTAGNALSPPANLLLNTVSVPSGGINPIMIASVAANNGGLAMRGINNAATAQVYTANLSVGATCLNSTIVANNTAGAIGTGAVGRNIYLYLPAYSFNPLFESAYLSSPIKSIKYTDIYQYQISNIPAGSNINQLITNGISNIKSVLILPFYAVSSNPATAVGVPVYQSPFDPAGAGPTSPLAHFTNFNVVVSGQNAIYNTQRYLFEEWNNQVYGCNSVNGGQMDGLTSGLISQLGWEMEYCYYYVNVSRMLPVEESVPKSVQIVGQNVSAFAMDYMVFVEYGCSIDVDILSGARVG